MGHLDSMTVAFLAMDGYEDSELTSPWDALEDEGATVVMLSPTAGEITGKRGHVHRVDDLVSRRDPDDFDALVLPGGVINADHLRIDEPSVTFVRAIAEADKPIAVICHGAWILIEADVAPGRTLTSYPSLRTDLINAGAKWVDEEAVNDAGLISSRTPKDLPAFNSMLIDELNARVDCA